MQRLDPKLDLVFKLLLTREPALLHHMLESVLTRPLGPLTVLDTSLSGERVGDKQVHFDIRASLHDGSRVDLEMQRRAPPALSSRLVYYTARDYGGQLRRGDQYHLLTPTVGIVWLVEPLVPTIDRLHSVFELRERHANIRLCDQLAIHLLQLSFPPPSDATGYTASVARWARFFTAQHDAEFDQLAAEHPIMALAKQTLEQLSLDPQARRLALEREDEFKLYQIDLAASRAEGEAKGRAEGEAKGKAEFLLKLLGLSFGPPSRATRARVETATVERLDAWVERVLVADCLDDVLAS